MIRGRAVLALHLVAATMLSLLGAVSRAADPPVATDRTGEQLRRCKTIADDSQRLTCYDETMGHDGMMRVPPSPAALPGAAPGAQQAVSAAPAGSAPRAAQPATALASAGAAAHASSADSLMSRYWELQPEDKRGVFNYTAYRPNLFLPLHLVSHINQRPSSPTRGVAGNLPNYQYGEAKIELSLRSKVAQDLALPNSDLWVAYTQVSMWQLWNHSASAPFRNTDYQPELIYVVPTPSAMTQLPGGWKWRMWQLGVVHQSNGQADPLSRSWNRGYVAAGLEKGDVQALVRYEQRLHETQSKDDNPDIVKYLGHFDAQFSWTPGLSEATLRWRPSFKGRGSVQVNWTYPFNRAQPDGLRWYLQLFDGYGETLTDYNFRLSSLSLGLTIFKF